MTTKPQLKDETLESIIARVADEFIAQLEAGIDPDIDDFATRYPQHAEAIRQVLPALQVVHHRPTDLNSSDPAVTPSAAPPRELGDFRILREIGRGGMGVVYEAEQLSLSRRIALKVLPFASILDPRQLQRFKNEARAAASLDHPHIVHVYGTGCERGVHYYAMQYIEGHNLAQVITVNREAREGQESRDKSQEHQEDSGANSQLPALDSQLSTLDPRETAPLAALTTEHHTNVPAYFRTVAELGSQAAEALDYAHQHGIVHRDIKPSNLMLDEQGKLFVTDFGLAQIESDANLTMTGDILGTLRYMSPEQALGQRGVVDQRSDVYSLGVTLYELLTLEPAVRGTERGEVLQALQNDEPRPLRAINRAIPVDLETIVLKAIARQPLERYATAQQLADDLQQFLDDKPILARRPGAVLRLRKWSKRHKGLTITTLAVVFLALAVIGGWKLQRDRRLREITLSVRELLAATRAGMAAKDYAAARQHLGEAQGHLNQAQWREGPLALALVNLSEEVSAKTRAEERFKQFQRLRERVHSAMGHISAFKQKEALKDCQTALKLYRVQDGIRWKRQPGFQNLDAKRQTEVEEGVIELLFLLARLEVISTYNADSRPVGHRRAIDALRRIETFHRPIAAAYLWIAQSWEALGEEKLAQEATQRAEKLRYTTALDYYLLGAFHQSQRKSKQALASYSLTLRRKPDYYLALFDSGRALFSLRRYEPAEAMATGAIAVNPRSAPAHFLRGLSCQFQGKFDLALEDFSKVVELDPQDYLGPYSQGLLLNRKGAFAQAVTAFDKALKLNRHSFSSHLYRGRGYARLGEHEKALADFTFVVDSLSGYAKVKPVRKNNVDHLIAGYLGRGLAHVKLGRYRDALVDAERALDLTAEDPSKADDLSREWLHPDYDATRIYSLASVQVAKDETEPERETLARRYADRAAELLQRVKDKGYTNFDVMLKETDLDPIRQHAGFQELLEKKEPPLKAEERESEQNPGVRG